MLSSDIVNTSIPRSKTNLSSRQFKSDPYRFYASLRTDAPVYRTVLPDKQIAWLVTRYDDVSAILKDPRFSKNRTSTSLPGQETKAPWMPAAFKPLARTMLDLDGQDHSRLRALAHKAFTPRIVVERRRRIQSIAEELLDKVEANRSMDLMRDLALPLPVTVISDLLGVPAGDRHKFRNWSKKIVAVSSGIDRVLIVPTVLKFMGYIRGLIAARRAAPGNDLISLLVQAEEAGDSLSEDELLAMIFLLLVAGHETTVNLIGSGTLALMQNRDQLELLRNDPSLTQSAVEELLRYTSPVELATERYAREELTLHGVTIPRGGLTLAVLGSANRDEGQFPNPDRLDITRQPNKHLAFGQGGHYCLGAPLARLEGQIAIQTLINRVPGIHPSQPAETLRWRRGLFLRGLEALPVEW